MKGYLYFVEFSNSKKWSKISLDLNVDQSYWAQYPQPVRMRWLEEKQPWGRLLKLSQQNPSELFRCAVPLEKKPYPSLSQLLAAKERTAGLSFSPGDMLRLGRALEGRCLTAEEFQKWLQHQWPTLDVTQWKRWAQLFYLMGKLRYTAGIMPVHQLRAEGGGIFARTLQRLRSRLSSHSEHHLACARCGSTGELLVWTDCESCGQRCPYCKGCLTMGRSRGCSVLLIGLGASSKLLPHEGHIFCPLNASDSDAASIRETESVDIGKWGLSPAQHEAVREGLHFLRNGIDAERSSSAPAITDQTVPFLIWAVTGAGKTEMIYPLIDQVLRWKGKVAVAAPRKDVVMELKPRMKKAFPQLEVIALYGGSEECWANASLVLATTHQLMRFEDAFDLVIIDELDAFPYHGDPKLAFAAKKALASQGRMIYLSATPPKPMQRLVEQRKLPHVKVPVRFHRHPLPVPQLIRVPKVKEWLKSRRLPRRLKQALDHSIEREAQIFLFAPAIRWVEPLVRLLRNSYPALQIGGTSSVDPYRDEKVLDFRAGKWSMLVTTTILERGVTIPKSDVFVLDADSHLFDEAALVQMAGRAGRSPQDPHGLVFFAASTCTASQKGAVRQIRHMNRLAKRKGYLQ